MGKKILCWISKYPLIHTLKDVYVIQRWKFKSSYIQKLINGFETVPRLTILTNDNPWHLCIWKALIMVVPDRGFLKTGYNKQVLDLNQTNVDSIVQILQTIYTYMSLV